MSDQRIFIVDDEVDYVDNLTMELEKAHYVTDIATGPTVLADALKAVSYRTYPVALVDIMFVKNDPTNRDGVKVLDKIKDLDEGTRAIPLTAQHSRSFVAELTSLHGAMGYLDKEEIGDNFDLVVETVRSELRKVQLKRYGEMKDAISLFESLDPTWVANTLSSLEPDNRYAGLKKFLSVFCDPLAPLLPPIASRDPVSVDMHNKVAMGRFWSKGLGTPVCLVLCRTACKNQVLNSPQKDCEPKPLIDSTDVSGTKLSGIVFRLKDASREDFQEKYLPRGQK